MVLLPSATTEISIHALLAESDVFVGGTSQFSSEFQSTLSLRRATKLGGVIVGDGIISIHALLAESDNATINTSDANFKFQSTLSLRRATAIDHQRDLHLVFQSTLSLRRATLHNPGVYHPGRNFNPRSPCGERQQIPPNWPYRFCLKCQFKDGEKSKKAKGSASAQASSPAYEKNKVRIPWGDFECFRFAPIK